MTINSINAI